MLFSGLRFTSSGFSINKRSELRELVESRGGNFSADAATDLTHIVANRGSTKKCVAARQLGNVALVAETWVRESIRCNRILGLSVAQRPMSLGGQEHPEHTHISPPKPDLSSNFSVKPLTGYCICVTGHSPSSRALLADKVRDLGGIYQGHLTVNVSHLLVDRDFNWRMKEKNAKVVFAERHNISVVHDCWLVALQSGLVVECEITDICRATPFYDLAGDLETDIKKPRIESSKRSSSKTPVKLSGISKETGTTSLEIIEPFSYDEAQEYCGVLLKENARKNFQEADARRALYEEFRTTHAKSNMVPHFEQHASHFKRLTTNLLEKLFDALTTFSSTPFLSGCVTYFLSTVATEIQSSTPRVDAVPFSSDVKTQSTQPDVGLNTWSATDIMTILQSYSPSHLHGDAREQISSILHSLERNFFLLRRGGILAGSVITPCLLPLCTHIVIVHSETQTRLSSHVEDSLRTLLSRYCIPLSRVVTSRWIVDSLLNRKEGFSDMYVYPFNQVDISSKADTSEADARHRSLPSTTSEKEVSVSPLVEMPIISASHDGVKTRKNEALNESTWSEGGKPSKESQDEILMESETFLGVSFTFSYEFVHERLQELENLVMKHGGRVLSLSSEKAVPSCHVVPHSHERLMPHSNFSPSIAIQPTPPWVSFLEANSPLGTPSDVTQRSSTGAPLKVTSTWVEMCVERKSCAPGGLSVQNDKVASANGLNEHDINTASCSISWIWYFEPIMPRPRRASPPPSMYSGTIIIHIDRELSTELTPIRMAITALGGMIWDSPAGASHVVRATADSSVRRPLVVDPSWIERSARAGYFVREYADGIPPPAPPDDSPIEDRWDEAVHQTTVGENFPQYEGQTTGIGAKKQQNFTSNDHVPCAEPRSDPIVHSLERKGTDSKEDDATLAPADYQSQDQTHSPPFNDPSGNEELKVTPSPEAARMLRFSPSREISTTNVNSPTKSENRCNSIERKQSLDPVQSEIKSFDSVKSAQNRRLVFSLLSYDHSHVVILRDAMQKLGASVDSDDISTATHLICTDPSQRESVLTALARGIWVLRPVFLDDCARHMTWLQEANYEWTRSKVGLKARCATLHLADACKTWRERREKTGQLAFHGCRLLVCATGPCTESYLRILHSGGAQQVHHVQEISSKSQCLQYTHVLFDKTSWNAVNQGIVQSPADSKLTPPIKRSGDIKDSEEGGHSTLPTRFLLVDWITYHLQCLPDGACVLWPKRPSSSKQCARPTTTSNSNHHSIPAKENAKADSDEEVG